VWESIKSGYDAILGTVGLGSKRSYDDMNNEVQRSGVAFGVTTADALESLTTGVREVSLVGYGSLRDLVTEIVKSIPLTKEALNTLLDENIYFPFTILLLRPHITHRMGTAVLTVGGASTGETLIGHADFQLGDNVAQKMHYGNFTMYLKSIIYKPDNVVLAENIYANGYVGGNDVKFYTEKEGRSYEVATAKKGSMYACLVPAAAGRSEYELPNPLDSTGAFSTNNPQLANMNGSRSGYHYATAAYYAKKYGFNNDSSASSTPDSRGYVHDVVDQYNTVCFQGHQSLFNPNNSNFDLVIENTGHWGNRIYPGCGKVRRGFMKTLEPVTYTTSFGAQKSVTSLGY
jgi:hypothetical protein